MTAFDYFLLAWWSLGIILAAGQIGKPRKTLTPHVFGWTVAITFGLMLGLILSRGGFA